MKYAGNIDKECVRLCDALNRFSGIKTTESCCGHSKQPFRIFFHAESLAVLPQLVYWFDGCHCGFYGWRVIACTDCAMSPVFFMIEGPTAAFQEADHIAALIEQDLKH